MGKKVAIVQSCYIPWKGYFDLINSVDEFILYDDMQYTKRDWRNRNKIKTKNGIMWLTIPVMVKNKYFQKICETEISDPKWNQRHWKSIIHHYSGAKHFLDYRKMFEELYLGMKESFLSQINYQCIIAICGILGIETKISWSKNYRLTGDRIEKLNNLCMQAGATEYLTGPTAKEYLNVNSFRNHGIKIRFMDYSGYPEYRQLHSPFEHGVSIIDLLFNEGPKAKKFMKSF